MPKPARQTDPDLPTVTVGALLAWTPLHVEITFKNLKALDAWGGWNHLDTDDINPGGLLQGLTDLRKNQRNIEFLGDRPFAVLIERKTGKLARGPLSYNALTWAQIKAQSARLLTRLEGGAR